MEGNRMIGMNQNNIRKALFYIFYGKRYEEHANDFSFEKYKYIIPMQNQFNNPITLDSYDTYCMYWIEEDESIVPDSIEEIGENEFGDTQYCKATILLRFCGKNSELWAKSFRHHCMKKDIYRIWMGTCNADKMEWVSPIIPIRAPYFGENTEICYDLRIRLKYKEILPVNWSLLDGLDISASGKINIEEEGENA